MGGILKKRFDLRLTFALALVSMAPALAGAVGTDASAPASHDVSTIRVVGLGYTGIFRALDVLLAAPFQLLPLGTHAARAGVASAVVAGLASAIAFVFFRGFVPKALARIEKEPSQGLVTAVCAVAVLTAALSPTWQEEACAPGGSVTGALLILFAAWAASVQSTNIAALAIGLAASYEPLVLLAALAGAVPFVTLKSVKVETAISFALGLAPLGLGFALRLRHLRIPAVPSLVSIERPGPRGTLLAFANAELGTILLLAAAVGLALAVLAPTMRRHLVSAALMAGVGALAVELGASHSGAALAGIMAVSAFAAIALAAAVTMVARAKIPFAQASAAMLVVLELVLPVRALDETQTRREQHARHGAALWTELAWGPLPVAAVLLVPDRGTMTRITASRATGEMRGDLVIVPSFAVDPRALAAEPKLAPLYRDIALGALPEELSLAQLAATRPLVTSFDPRWDRNLARHFVPIGLSSIFEPEPRGVSDRKKALDLFTADKDRLVRVAVAKHDLELSAATATLLRQRAVGMAATGERDVLSKALDDLRPFAPDDAVANLLVRRIVTSKGPIDVKDLVP